MDAESVDLNPDPDHRFAITALVLALISTVLSLVSAGGYPLPSWMQLAKDVVIFGSLCISAFFYFLRYRQALSETERLRRVTEAQLNSIRGLLSKQIDVYHNLMKDMTEALYDKVAPGIGVYPNRFNYGTPSLNQTLSLSMTAVIDAARDILFNQIQARYDDFNEPISISVKAYVTGAMAKELCVVPSEVNVSHEDRYIITLDRDHRTKIESKDREIRKACYEIKKNTDFARILSKELQYFASNDLKSLEAKQQYVNSNPDWGKHYNATLVVPIWQRQNGTNDATVFGFLTVDSTNKDRRELFDAQSRAVIAFGAELLALIFLSLELYDQLPDEVKTKIGPPRVG